VYTTVRPVLAELEGEVLDVGCQNSPYRAWMERAGGYVGLDVEPGPGVDVVVTPAERWPFDGDRFDAVVCTQVLEHVESLEHTLGELARVTRPGGRLVVSVPFIANEHGTPHDYRRFTRHGLPALVGAAWSVDQVVPQGGVGSSSGMLLLNWVELTLTRSAAGSVALLLFMPLWIAFTALVNATGQLLDRVDRTGLFYGNLLVVATRRNG
jgi:SAM-dependent methyltransferase